MNSCNIARYSGELQFTIHNHTISKISTKSYKKQTNEHANRNDRK